MIISAKAIFRKLNNQSAPKLSIEYQNMTFHYQIGQVNYIWYQLYKYGTISWTSLSHLFFNHHYYEIDIVPSYRQTDFKIVNCFIVLDFPNNLS